eukprot:s293_g2.t2
MAPSVGKVSTGFQLGGLHGGLGSPFNSNPLNSSPAQAFNPMNPQSSNVAAAAGAGLGGMVVFHITQKDCVAPPACEQVKQCMAEAAKKAFMGSAIMGAAASTSDDNQPPEAAMAMPPEGQWGFALRYARPAGSHGWPATSETSLQGVSGYFRPAVLSQP